MKPGARELWWALAAIVAITAIYLAVVRSLQGVPAASSLFGHTIGVIGFVLMLMTETLYSLRKRSRRARWGRPAAWLRFHIFTGLVGAYMVLLHSSFKFNGLAGIVMLLTVVVVVSGFIGRYIYTAVPRTADGVMLEASDLQVQIAASEAELQRWQADRPDLTMNLRPAPVASAEQSPLRLVFGRTIADWQVRLRWRSEMRHLDPASRAAADQLETLLRRQRTLQRQAASLVTARRLLGVWHSVHIPIGLALFTAAFVHVAAALYYATLLH